MAAKIIDFNIAIQKLLTPYNFTDTNNTGRIRYIVIHYVGALGGAKANCQYYASQYVGASAHYFVGFEGEIWQSVEDEDTAWHCGASSYVHKECRNSNSIGIEMCVRKKNTGSLGATDKDWYFEEATVQNTIALTKYLMKKYNVPADHVIRHYDVTGKICPNPYVYNYTKHVWTAFKSAIADCSTGGSVTITDNYYRVRTSWENAGSQIFAGTLEGAKSVCTAGYTVYDSKGKAVYTPEVSAAAGFQASQLNGLTEAKKIATIAPLYQEVMKKTGMLASVGLAQFCLESGYGTTDLAQYANNLHGMKKSLSGNTWAGSTWDGKSTYGKYSPEVINGVTVMQYSVFRKYPCCGDSIADRAAYFTGAMNGSKRRYPGIESAKNYKDAIHIIFIGGYATDPNYESKLIKLVEKYKLYEYDNVEVQIETPSADILPSTELPWYRVRRIWGDTAGQKGAYHSLDLAKKCADDNPGYKVFDDDGKMLYGGAAEPAAKVPYLVRVEAKDLNIRKGAGTNTDSVKYIPQGIYTIVEEKAGTGSAAGWGKLKSGLGWISLDYATKIVA